MTSADQATVDKVQAEMARENVAKGRVDDDCELCHYCGVPFGRTRHEHDHAPVPQVAGGLAVVAICVTCHDLKDRGGLRGLPADEFMRATLTLMEGGALADAALGSPPRDWPQGWTDMTRWERLVWARTVMLANSPTPPPDKLVWSLFSTT